MAVFSIFLSYAFSQACGRKFPINRITDLSAAEGTDPALHIDSPATILALFRFSDTRALQTTLENSIIDSKEN
jgi:hypothetical protein